MAAGRVADRTEKEGGWGATGGYARQHPSPQASSALCPLTRGAVVACRAVLISLKKKDSEWWDGLTKDKTLKRFIKTDFAKWCERG